MLPTRSGSLRLFEFSGIEVFLHWSWFLVGAFEIQSRTAEYSSLFWNVLEYLSLFLIVLLHEFGHALACRQVGGRAHQIVLWPLGGVAFVSPPPRPGATLWSIAAGPLVNVVLMPILFLAYRWMEGAGWEAGHPDAFNWVSSVLYINAALLFFNILPIYPLDGGQILHALLWFPFGRTRSLLIATGIGFVGGLSLLGVALWIGSIWPGVLASFLLWRCLDAFKQAMILRRVETASRRAGFACPACQAMPQIGNYWVCGECRCRFDTFETQGVCPQCSTTFPLTSCLNCGAQSEWSDWKQ